MGVRRFFLASPLNHNTYMSYNLPSSLCIAGNGRLARKPPPRYLPSRRCYFSTWSSRCGSPIRQRWRSQRTRCYRRQRALIRPTASPGRGGPIGPPGEPARRHGNRARHGTSDPRDITEHHSRWTQCGVVCSCNYISPDKKTV